MHLRPVINYLLKSKPNQAREKIKNRPGKLCICELIAQMNDEVLRRFLKVNYYGSFFRALFVFGLFTQLQIVIQFQAAEDSLFLPAKAFFGTGNKFSD